MNDIDFHKMNWLGKVAFAAPFVGGVILLFLTTIDVLDESETFRAGVILISFWVLIVGPVGGFTNFFTMPLGKQSNDPLGIREKQK